MWGRKGPLSCAKLKKQIKQTRVTLKKGERQSKHITTARSVAFRQTRGTQHCIHFPHCQVSKNVQDTTDLPSPLTPTTNL